MRKKLFYVLFSGIFSFVYFPISGFSASDISEQIDKFSYEVLFPDNQKNSNTGYYDLLMQPGEKQTLQLRLTNQSEKPLKVETRVNSAKTNGNGVIEYGTNELKPDASLVYNLEELMTGPQEVILPANSSKIIEFKVALPTTPFEGYLAGGIQLKPMTETDTEQQEQAIVINKLAYLVGVLISESDVKKVMPELKLNNVSLKLKDGDYNLFVNLSNVKPVFVEKMAVEIKIKEINQKIPLLEFEQKDMRMAPNSMINIPISLHNQEISSGEYTAEIHITEETGRNWTWVKNFTLMRVAAEKLKQKEPDKHFSFFNYWWLLFLSVVIIIVCLWLFFSRKRRKGSQVANYRMKKKD